MDDFAFVIIEMSKAGEWIGLHGRNIPEDKRPTVLQLNRKVAWDEALRLSKAHPDKIFVVFSAAFVAQSIDVPTHCNLDGKPMQFAKEARILQLSEDDVPF